MSFSILFESSCGVLSCGVRIECAGDVCVTVSDGDAARLRGLRLECLSPQPRSDGSAYLAQAQADPDVSDSES